MQQASGAHQIVGDARGLRDPGEFRIEHVGERQQVITLVLQRDAHRADAARILRLADGELLDDEVEQRLPRGEGRPRQRQEVMAEPLGERADVAGQLMRLGFSLPGRFSSAVKLPSRLSERALPTVASSFSRRVRAPWTRLPSVLASVSHWRWM